MKILTCNKCQSQFDVTTMQPGASIVCGKCRNLLQVPAAAPVIQPVPVVRPMAQAPAQNSAPATVVLSPDEMRRALAAARGQTTPDAAPQGRAQPKLPAAMEARRQQQQSAATASRAGGSSQTGAPAPAPIPAAPAGRAAVPAPVGRPAATAARPATPAAKSAAAPAPVRAAAPARPAAPAVEAAPAPVAGGGRSSRRARGGGGDDAGDDAPAKKSKTPLYAGIGAGALLVVVGGVMMMKGKGKDEATGPSGANQPANAGNAGGTAGGTAQNPANAGGANPVDPVPANLDEWGKFLRMTPVEQKAFAATKRNDAMQDVSKLKDIFDWFSSPKLTGNSVAQETVKLVPDDALRLDAACDWANTAKGRKNAYETVRVAKQECGKAFSYPEADEIALDALLVSLQKEPWTDAKEAARIDGIVARVRARNKMIEENPRYGIAMSKAAWLRNNPLFKDYKFEVRFADPYVICQQYQELTGEDAHKNKDRVANANRMANRDAIIFSELNRRFREMFADRFKLPELKDKGRVLFAVITWDNAAFIELHRKAYNGDAPSPWIRAFYSPPEQKIFHYLGTDSLTNQDEMPVAHDRVQKVADQVTFHEGTHQLQHEYGAIYRGKPLVDGDPNVPPRKAMWFDEGFAEFMGAVECERSKKDDLVGATFFHNRLLLERLHQVRGNGRENNYRDIAKKWTIEQLIQPNHNGELLTQSGKLYPQNGVYMANLFYARAWGLVHFMWFYDNGKYRSNITDYMGTVFKEEHGPDALAKCFKRKSPKDWKGIEDEFEWYWDRCLARQIGFRNPESRSNPYNTETDPPEGKYDPNADKEEDEDK